MSEAGRASKENKEGVIKWAADVRSSAAELVRWDQRDCIRMKTLFSWTHPGFRDRQKGFVERQVKGYGFKEIT